MIGVTRSMTSRVSRKSWWPPYHGSGTSPLPSGSRSRYRQMRGVSARRSARIPARPRTRPPRDRRGAAARSGVARSWPGSGPTPPARRRGSGARGGRARRTRRRAGRGRRGGRWGCRASSSETPALSTTTSTPARAAAWSRIAWAIVERQMLPVHTIRTRAGRVMVGSVRSGAVGTRPGRGSGAPRGERVARVAGAAAVRPSARTGAQQAHAR